ncbi:MAG: tripartite tricarboxylate transporter substrate binding protein [Lautropia sp.]
MQRRIKAALFSTLAIACALAGGVARADVWPSRTVKLVSPFPPGGTTDLLARVLAQPLASALGQQVIVENRSGGGGSIGTGIVAKSPPDGYTWVVVFDTHAVNPVLIPNMSFDTRKDLDPVMLVATGAMVITAHKSQPYKSLGDLIAAAKAKPDTISFGSIGSGSLAHLAMTQMGALAGFKMVHVPYKGGGPLTADAIAGHVPIAMGTSALMAPHIKSGAVRPLAVSSATRDPSLPDVPTIAEQGIPGFEALAWWGVFTAAGTPAPIVARMNAEMSKILQDPKVREQLSSRGMNLRLSTPAQLGSFLNGEMDRWAKVVREYGIRAGD